MGNANIGTNPSPTGWKPRSTKAARRIKMIETTVRKTQRMKPNARNLSHLETVELSLFLAILLEYLDY